MLDPDRLTVGLVVRNEAHRLGPLLTLCAGFHLLVVDQCSDDGTIDIAQSHGAEVVKDLNHGYADPSRPLLVAQCDTPWMLMLDADELPTFDLWLNLEHLTETRGAWLKRSNWIGGAFYSEEQHYRLFPVDNIDLRPRLHGIHRPFDIKGVVEPEYVAIWHAKTFSEQLQDDEQYERMGQTDHRYLDRARDLGLTGRQLDAMSRAERFEKGFP